MNNAVDPLLGAALERRYRLDALIARGGMSAVYLGHDFRLGRSVAVKVMDAAYSHDPVFLKRFDFEARAVAGLKHAGLVAVYDQGIDADTAFLVMELVEGGSLRELLRERGPMPPHAVVAALDPVLGALGTAHRAGLVHRDVKPENILISDDGEVKIADFGLVRAVAEAGVTSASVILGTAAYLSPEQVESTHADARSDVYSTGIVMFELLTGRTPFRGDTPLGLAYQRLTYDVPAPSAVVPGIPPEIDELVLRATERDPRDRYLDGFDLRRALLDAADELDLPPFTVPAPVRSAERESVSAFRSRGVPGHGLPPTPSVIDTVPPSRTRTVTDPNRPASSSDDDRYYDRDNHDDHTVDLPDRFDDDFDDVDDNVELSTRAGLAAFWIFLVLLSAACLASVGWWLGNGFLS
ncbi:serine/threonine protein kinase PknL [Gordonia effusa NBRC 100432]|uniref:non-specific serine/threonine protein kinase n=1 Tax=Gordonia effusa NBRC 100432 TaxID=1077974 RepID=H0R2Q4_9ACTN|nr:protein kinase [Gordonia effusa]GAB19355.1 serine/threonine protein kinase PknL [Gordonia effusa NBRC 100432]